MEPGGVLCVIAIASCNFAFFAVRGFGGAGGMHRRLDQSAAAVLVALAFGMCAARELRAQEAGIQEASVHESRVQDAADDAAMPAPTPAPSAASVHIAGDAAALEVHVHRSTIADVLSALAGLNIHYRSPSALNEAIDGVYTGSLRRVLSRVLNGYDYAIKADKDKLEVIVLGRSDDRESPALIVTSSTRRRLSD